MQREKKSQETLLLGGEATSSCVNKGASYKISAQKSIAFQMVRNNYLENENFKTPLQLQKSTKLLLINNNVYALV